MSEQNKNRMANYMALETAVINGEEALVKKLLDNRPMLDIEKSYLLELAQLNNNHTIIKLLEDLPVKEIDKNFKA
jgi:ankyrin repeat protein